MEQTSKRPPISVGDRSYFGRQWLESARTSYERGDVFGAFFAGYIALVGGATQLVADNNKGSKFDRQRDETWEGKAIVEAMRLRAPQVVRFVESDQGKRITRSLRLREIPGEPNSRIISTYGDREFKDTVDFLERQWSEYDKLPWTPETKILHAEKCAHLLRRIRNRLFHGEKLNDPHGSDAALLDGVTPFLFGIIEVLLAYD